MSASSPQGRKIHFWIQQCCSLRWSWFAPYSRSTWRGKPIDWWVRNKDLSSGLGGFGNPPLSRLPCCRRHWKDKDLESQAVKRHLQKENWTLAHCYFANMGFFVCRKKETASSNRSAADRGLFVRTPRDHKWRHQRQKQTGLVGQTLCRSSNITTHPFHYYAAYSRCTFFRSLRQSHYSLLFAARWYTALTFTSLKNLNGHWT